MYSARVARETRQETCWYFVDCKEKMADAEPYCIVVVMSQERASSLEHGFQQPSGVAARRPISEQVQKNISSIAPRCLKQGITNNDAFSYFMSWSRGELSRPQRPFSYVHLQNRCASLSSPNLKHQVGPHQLELNMLICLLVGMMRILMMMLNM